MKQLTREQAIAISQSGEWKDWTDEEIVRFQLFQDRLAIPFSRFHEALENVLGRPVYTHELGLAYDKIVDEYQRERAAPTFHEIISLIPPDKLIVLGLDDIE